MRPPFKFCSNFKSNSTDILAVCETNLNDSIDSIRKDSVTHIHGLAVYVKEGPPIARDLSLENSMDSYLYFRLALLHSVSYFFFLYQSPLSLCMLFDSIYITLMRFSLSTHVLVCLSLETLKSIIRTDLAYCV